MWGIIGAVGGCYIRCKVPAVHRLAYTNRKMFTSVTLQAACNQSMSFIDRFTGYPSSVHDSRIFRNPPLYNNVSRDRENYFSNGEYIIGDKAYTLSPWCISPFISRAPLTNRQLHFNKRHASARVIIVRAFALLIGRFRRLRYLDMKRFDWAI